jgi:hypothetical protein
MARNPSLDASDLRRDPAVTGTLRIEPFSKTRVPALRAFNQRLAEGGSSWQFPEDPPEWLPRVPGSGLFQEQFLLLEGENVRGVYMLKHQQVSLRCEIRQAGNLYFPLSEGSINPEYSLVGARLFADALRRESLLFMVGGGGENTQVTRLARALGWQLHPVPFYFKVLHGARFLRQIRYLRTTRLRKLLLDLAAISGAGWVATTATRALLTRRPRSKSPLQVEVVDRFGPWADELWRGCAAFYSFLAVRTSEVLNRVYPPGRPGLFRLRITRAGEVIGYAIVHDAQAWHPEMLGEMRVGTLVDGFARPEHAQEVVWLGARTLEQRGVDLIISNQSHPAWGAALRRTGFIEGPTHCTFAAAKPLAEQIRTVDPDLRELHLSRGDGDWPWAAARPRGLPNLL